MMEALRQESAYERQAIPRSLPNYLDHRAIEELSTTPISQSPVDCCASLLFDTVTETTDQQIAALRYSLIRVYLRAGTIRLNAKANKAQMGSAKRAVAALTKALYQLDKVAPPTRRGLQAVFGPPPNDCKGLEESNELHLACWQLKLDTVSILMRLWAAIERENDKPARTGESKKRLRTLVEQLADWWVSTGRSIAPYVCANRRDGGPAVISDRQGDFVALARAVFCKLDTFSDSEVLAAITNVHEARLASEKIK